jgi:opacity protein-like surface antigen
MGNFLVRFAFGRFQPYLGGGAGGYYAESQNVEVTIANRKFNGDGGSDSGFAWQLIGGADYYFAEKFSTFIETNFSITRMRDSPEIALISTSWWRACAGISNHPS